jgi:ATP-dependent DNA helicase PIF1
MSVTQEPAPEVKCHLTTKQQIAFEEIVYKRSNIFLTGMGGTGKSFIIKLINERMSKEHNVGLTSLTGVSALLIGGVTLHSYLGIGLGLSSFEQLYKKVRYNKIMNNRWMRLDLLIVDEVSMFSIELFEKLEKLARHLRKDNRPFGGIQLLLCGDFLQLPVVLSNKFCFESPVWATCISKVIMLDEVIRQKDKTFISVLNKIRMGNIDQECKDVIGAREIKYYPGANGFIPTMLYATNSKVDVTNAKYYGALKGNEYNYKIEYTWKQNVRNKEYYENAVKLPHELNLKIGAQVMHLVNEPMSGLVNGSRGIVKAFVGGFPEVLFTNGHTQIVTRHCLEVEEKDDVVMSYSQIPLKLAWAMSYHKAQGSTLSLVRVDLKNIFEYGQFYVALSRCESLDGLYIRNLDWLKVKTHPRALEFYRALKN